MKVFQLATLIQLIGIIFLNYVELKYLTHKTKEALAFRLVHINDIHAHFDPINENLGRCHQEQAQNKQCYGGVARLKTAVDQIRNMKPKMDSIFINAGDYYQVSYKTDSIENYSELRVFSRV